MSVSNQSLCRLMGFALIWLTVIDCAAEVREGVRTRIRCPLLESLDKFRIINTDNIAEFNRQIDHIRSIKFTTPDGRGFTLAQLAQLEQEGHLPAGVGHKLVGALLARLIGISQPYMHDLRNHRPAFIKIMISWGEQSGRTDNLLLGWSEVESDMEEEFLRERVVSLRLMDSFLGELQDFLNDLIYSCPHSREFHQRHAARDKPLDAHHGPQ